MNDKKEKEKETQILIPLDNGDLLQLSLDDGKKLYEKLKKIFNPKEEDTIKKLKDIIEKNKKEKDKPFDPWIPTQPIPYYPPIETPKTPWYPEKPYYPTYPIITYCRSNNED